MTNPCGCNWNLGQTCYMHACEERVERLERVEREQGGLTRDEAWLLDDARKGLARQRAAFDAARAKGLV